MKTLNIVYLV